MNKPLKLAFFTLILALTANIAFSQAPTTDEGWFRLGIQQYNQSKFLDAINSYSQCISLNSNADGCFLNRGSSSYKLGKYKEAFDDYSILIKLRPNDARGYFERGQANLKLNKYYQAEVDYSKAIELKPDYAVAYTNRAYIHYVLQRHSAAILDYSKVIEIEPRKSVNIYIARGALYCGQGSIALAQADEKKAIALGAKIENLCLAKAIQKTSPCACGVLQISGPITATNSGETMTFSARVTGEKDVTYKWEVDEGKIISGQGTSSIKVLTEGLSDSALNATVTTKSCSEVCVHTGSETGIITSVPKAFKLDEFESVAANNFRLDAFILELQNQNSAQGYVINFGTEKQVDQAQQLIRNHLINRKFDLTRIVFINYGEGRPITRLWIVPWGADADFDATPGKSASSFDPASLGFLDPSRVLPMKTADEWVDFGVQQHKEKKLTDALASFKKAIELDPKLARSYNNIGIVYFDLGNIDLAIENYSKAIQLKPDLFQAYNNRAIALQKQNKIDAAITDATRAIWIEPKNAFHYLLRANLNCTKGLKSLAKMDEQKAIELGAKVVSPCAGR